MQLFVEWMVNETHYRCGFKTLLAVKDELMILGKSCLANCDHVIIPLLLHQHVLELAHKGHPEVVKMKQKCLEAVWQPKID